MAAARARRSVSTSASRGLAGRGRMARRRAQVKLAVERYVWAEAEGSEAEDLVADLDDILELDALSGAVAGDDDIEAHVSRVCAELGVDTPETLAARRAEAPSAASPISADAASEPQVNDPKPWRSSG